MLVFETLVGGVEKCGVLYQDLTQFIAVIHPSGCSAESCR
jgi:hypothetical protein